MKSHFTLFISDTMYTVNRIMKCGGANLDCLQIPDWAIEKRASREHSFFSLVNSESNARAKVLNELLEQVGCSHLKNPDLFFAQTADLLGCSFGTIDTLLTALHLSNSFDAYKAAAEDLKKWATLSLFIKTRAQHSLKMHSRQLGVSQSINTLMRLIPLLPHTPTSEQVMAAINCLRSYSRQPIQRHMLFGDVGYGKTTSIGLLTATAVLNGWTAVIMCPLTPLANQIYSTLISWFGSLDISIKLVTSNTEEYKVEKGCLYVGTTALLHCDIQNVDLLCVDEEQRFGVSQIKQLLDKDCHYLASSATPIPRTVSLISLGVFKELALTKPFIEKCIISEVISPDRFHKVIEAVRQCLQDGGQALFICCQKQSDSRSQSQHLYTCDQAFTKLNEFFPNDVVMVNSDLSIEQNESNLSLVRRGEKQILVATTSVEVGIDLPAAKYIGIYNPERFGLAQLHQLRGRIGRQGDYSKCHLIISERVNAEQIERLNYFADVNDGRLIAEFDADRRGWGSIFDTKQSGKYQHTFLKDFSPSIKDMTKIRNLFINSKVH